MIRVRKSVIATTLVLMLGGATILPAAAANKGGSVNCTYVTYGPKVSSNTSGNTSHGYQDLPTNDTKTVYFASGGQRVSYGSPFQHVNWNVVAPVITTAIGTCGS